MSTFSLRVRGKLLRTDKPLLMGILNITPDSFYTGSRFSDPLAYLEKARQMLDEGAAILDIGGQSTRPGARRLSAAEESDRVLPVITALIGAFPQAVLSIDTYHAVVARQAVAAGVAIINDISAGALDPDMLATAGGLQVPYIAMHMQGTPKDMQTNPHYENVVEEVFDYFVQKTEQCRSAGIQDVLIDPGFGFGKTLAHNYQLLQHLGLFQQLDCPVLAGLSRKSMIYKLLKTTAEEALNGTSALNLLALQQGVQILRVHDVRAAGEVVQLWEYYRNQA